MTTLASFERALAVHDLAVRKPEPPTLIPRPGNPGAVHEVFLPNVDPKGLGGLQTTPPMSANDRYADYHAERRAQQRVGRAMATAVAAAGWPVIEGRCEVQLVYYLRNDGWADCDNTAPTIKPCLDALRPPKHPYRPWSLGLIPEDHSGVVRHTGQTVVQKSEDPHPELGPRLWVVLIEVE